MAQALSFAPWEFWWLQVVSVGVLVALLVDEISAARAALRGWLFGVGWLVAGLWWLYISLHVYGFLPAWLSVAAVAVLAALLSLYYALAAWGWARMRRRWPLFDAMLVAPSGCWPSSRAASSSPAFPWIAGG